MMFKKKPVEETKVCECCEPVVENNTATKTVTTKKAPAKKTAAPAKKAATPAKKEVVPAKKQVVKVEDQVKTLLEKTKRTRNDDFYLYRAYVAKYVANGKEILAGTLDAALSNSEKLTLPSFEAIIRAKRRVFTACPELKPEQTK